MINGTGGFFNRSHWANHCLLIETNHGLVLIDSAFSCHDLTHPSGIVRFILRAFGSGRNIEETALYQIKKMGYSASDVHHIVLTHLHPGHAGGISDFPDAQVHIYAKEFHDALHPKNLQAWFGYEKKQWSHSPKWVTHTLQPADWYGFDSTPIIENLVPQMHLVHLPGHTPGHCGVAVQTDQGWLFHCGDSFSYHGEVYPINNEKRHSADLFQRFAEANRSLRLNTISRLLTLAQEQKDNICLINSHDSFYLK